MSDPDVDLAPAFRALKELRAAYRQHARGDIAACEKALRRVRALMRSESVRTLVDPLMGPLASSTALPADQRKRLLAKEAELALQIGDDKDRKLIKKALSDSQSPS